MKRLSKKMSAEKSLGEKIIRGFQRTLIVGSGVLVLGGGLSGCKPVEGQENTTTTSISAETTTNPDLKDVAPERLEFTKNLLNLYDKSSAEYGSTGFETAFNKIKDFITPEQILNYGKTGEGLSVIKNKDGSPAVALINCNDRVTGCFKTMVSKMSKRDPDFLEKMTKNGMVAFMVNRYDANTDGNFTFNESGLIVWNLSPKDSNIIIGSGGLERPVETEAFGIKMYNLGGDYEKYVGFIKEQLSSDCWWNLYKKTGEVFCKEMSYSSYMFCKTTYNMIYAPVDFRDKEIQDLINSARKLVSLFGGTEAEISASIADRPDWNLGDIK